MTRHTLLRTMTDCRLWLVSIDYHAMMITVLKTQKYFVICPRTAQSTLTKKLAVIFGNDVPTSWPTLFSSLDGQMVGSATRKFRNYCSDVRLA